LFFVASRGHHGDIGGITPGSMPPFSKYLFEEGAAFKSFKLVCGGVFDTDGGRWGCCCCCYSFVFYFVLLFRWCGRSCGVHLCSLHSAHANLTINVHATLIHCSD
jgi:hypothetical protein